MSTAIDSAGVTTQERSASATRELCRTLGLGALKPAELKFLTIALAEVATSEAQRNMQFAHAISHLYQELLPTKPAKATRGKGAAKRKEEAVLIPVGTVDPALLDPYAPPNPWALQILYGNHQLQQALERYSLAKLKEALPLVQERYPGSKPKALTKKGIATYIFSQLTATH